MISKIEQYVVFLHNHSNKDQKKFGAEGMIFSEEEGTWYHLGCFSKELPLLEKF